MYSFIGSQASIAYIYILQVPLPYFNFEMGCLQKQECMESYSEAF